MVRRTATVKNKYGIHCRPATEIAKAAQEEQCTLTVHTADDAAANPANVLQLMGLGLTRDSEVTIEVEGPDEEEAAERIAGMFEKVFEYVPGE